MKREIIKILNRREFYFVAVVMFAAVFLHFSYMCYLFRESPLSNVISAYEGTILTNKFKNPFNVVYGLLLPICSSIISSTVGIEERKSRVNGCIFTRVSKKKYYKSQGKAVFLVAFSLVLFSLLLSLLLAVSMFPVQGFNTMAQADYDRLLDADSEFLLDFFYRLHPYINIVIFIVLRALFAGAFAFMAYGVSFCVKGNRITTILSPFAAVVLIQFIMQCVKQQDISEEMFLWFNTDILGINHYGSFWMLVIIWVCIMTVGVAGVIKGGRMEELA